MQRKEKTVVARVEVEFYNEIQDYLEGIDLAVGQLIRFALKEYMWGHPKSNFIKRKKND